MTMIISACSKCFAAFRQTSRNVAYDVVTTLRTLAGHVRQLREAGDPNPESVIDELNRLIAPYGLKLNFTSKSSDD